jgi:predicted amino acid-binding ACT domain protein
VASQRIRVTAVTGDAIATEEIRRVDTPSRVNFWASAVTGTDELGVLLNRTEILPAGNVNIEASADVIDTSRDQLLFGTVVGRGQLRVPVTAVTTEIQFLLSVEPLALS